MADRIHPNPTRPSKFEDRYRAYLDESGDHVFRETKDSAHRYLCLLGCWFRNPDYLKFHEAVEVLKARYLPHHPDDPVILHREDMINARKAFKSLRDAAARSRFDDGLLEVIKSAEFRVIAVVIDERELRRAYAEAAAHPYQTKCNALFEHVYESYLGDGKSSYTEAA